MRSYDRALEVVLIVLPWVWIGAAAVLAALSVRARRPGLLNAFALVLGAYGVTDFFVVADGRPGWSLAILKGLCIVGLYAILFSARGAKGDPSVPSRGSRSGR